METFSPLTLLLVIVAIVTVLATGYAYFRSSAVKVWEQNSEAYRARVELLEEQNARLVARLTEAEARIKELESLPNWQQVVNVIQGAETRIISRVESLTDKILADAQVKSSEH